MMTFLFFFLSGNLATMELIFVTDCDACYGDLNEKIISCRQVRLYKDHSTTIAVNVVVRIRIYTRVFVICMCCDFCFLWDLSHCAEVQYFDRPVEKLGKSHYDDVEGNSLLNFPYLLAFCSH